jgi:hypothetical protein
VLYVNLVVHREYSSPLSRLQRSTSTTPRVWVLRLVTRLVAPLVIDYSASRRLVVDYFTSSRSLVVDYFASAARPGASARRVARHVAWLNHAPRMSTMYTLPYLNSRYLEI